MAAARRQIPIRIIWLVFVGIFWVFFCIFACVKKRSRQKAQLEHTHTGGNSRATKQFQSQMFELLRNLLGHDIAVV